MKKLTTRFQDSIGALFKEQIGEIVFLSSPSDIGVRRNLGRPGARHAPECILYQFKKLNNHLKIKSFSNHIISHQVREKVNFKNAQQEDTKKISNIISKNQNFIHLGGGHDHVFPLLGAIDQLKEIDNIFILNIDAHLDTRIDDEHHSGTPFRNFDQTASKPFFLYQYGIHNFANSQSTQSPLDKNKMYQSQLNFNEFNQNKVLEEIHRESPFKIDEKTFVLISLDCDALHSSFMQAVSAVNHYGIELEHCLSLINCAQKLSPKNAFGIYEYNPLYDSHAGSSARSLAYLIHEYILKK